MDKITKTLISATFIIAVGMPMVSSAAIPACPIPNDGGVRVNFTNAPWLLAADYSNWQHETSVYSINLSAGNYQVTLASYDDHPNAEDQQHEQFFVSLLNGGSLVKNSVASPDLPQNITMGYWNVGTISLPTAVNGIKAVHAFYPNGGAESIVPICATFVKISDPVQPPTVDIKANSSNGPITVANGSEVVLSWVSANAISCSASGSWNGVKSLNNSETSSPLTSTSVFGITCINSNGQSVFDSVTVNVSQNNSIGVTIIANPTTVNQGGSSTLTWTTTNAVSCFADGGNWSGSKSANGSSEVQNNLQATQVYGITCVNSLGNSAHASATVNVIQNVPDPTVDIKANSSNGPITIPYNTQATLSWVSQNATECHANGGPWTGPKPLNNNTTATNNLTSSVTFTITCTNAIGASDSDSVTINVGNQQVPPTVDIKANSSNGPITIAYGTSATLSWVSTDADYCTASGAWSGNQDTNSSKSTGTLFSSKTYTITCYNTTGSDSDSVTVNVSGTQEEDPTVDLVANPTTVTSGNRATLSWTSSNADYCYASGGAWSGSNKPTNSSEQTNILTQTSTFTITCVNSSSGKSASDTATVAVNQQNVTPTVTLYASPSTIPYGTQSTLYWSSNNATSCNTSGGPWTGPKALNSNESTNVLYVNTTYSITCTSSSGASATANTTVFVNNQGGGGSTQAPTLNLYANPSQVPSGSNSTLYWNTTNADYCVASGDSSTGLGTGWYGNRSTNGSEVVYNITTNKNYILTCYGPGGSVVRNTTVSPIGQVYGVAAPTLTIYALPTPVNYGNASTVYWNATNVDTCYASGNWYGTKTITGQYATGPLFADADYTINCYGLGGSITRTATVPVIRPVVVTPVVIPVVKGTAVSGTYAASIEKAMENLATSDRGTTVSARPGNELRYTITVRNTGTLTLTNLVVRDPLSDRIELKTASDNGTYDYTNRTVTWKIARLSAGESKSVNLLVRVVMCDTDIVIENKAYVDNSQIAEVTSNSTVAGVTTGPLKIVIDNTQSFVNSGDSVTYTIHYTNDTNTTFRGATLGVYIPSGMIIEGYSNTCTIEGNTLKNIIGDIAPGKSGQIQITAKIDNSVLAGEVLTTRAVVTYTDASGTPRESSATTISTVSGDSAYTAAVNQGTNRPLRFLPDTFFGWLLLLLLIIILAIFIKRLLSKEEKKDAEAKK
ncbi:MAG TPA: hypothetical protein VJJ22_01235 [Candidatus Paceibacterota bacterium]